jgi:aspartyl-tRNA(Asn)/glutamyl-tRNA(Gln) amidotransferase subunit C
MIDKDTVKKLGHLARMRIQDSELDKFSNDLSAVIKWFELLDEAPLPESSVEIQVDRPTFQRQDVVADGNQAEQIVLNAKESKFNMFSVPKVVE